jgi:hypothetical protein
MSTLTAQDLLAIRQIIREELQAQLGYSSTTSTRVYPANAFPVAGPSPATLRVTVVPHPLEAEPSPGDPTVMNLTVDQFGIPNHQPPY